MKNLTLILSTLALLSSCSNPIKNEDAEVIVEEGTVPDSTVSDTTAIEKSLKEQLHKSTQHYWVGYFNPHEDVDLHDKFISADEGLHWNRSNKISIKIDQIIGDSITGHSVVAGNHRPFYGKLHQTEKGKKYVVREPGDDPYDGQFTFSISEGFLVGIWEAYKKTDIPKREYKLSKKSYTYNPDIMLEKSGRYIKWHKYKDRGVQFEVYDEGTPGEEVYEWVKKEYATTTDKVYEINASNTALSKEDVDNLTNGDLVVIRNTIYARHGYSFKNRPLRVFFDGQDWYIPVHADIKQDFTEIEKKNIQLLLRYEKNAKEYYDYFGRG